MVPIMVLDTKEPSAIPVTFSQVPKKFCLFRGRNRKVIAPTPERAHWLALNTDDASIYGAYVDEFETTKKLLLMNPQDIYTRKLMASAFEKFAHETNQNPDAFEQAFIYSPDDPHQLIYRHSEFGADDLILQGMRWASAQGLLPKDVVGWTTRAMDFSAEATQQQEDAKNGGTKQHHAEVVLFNPAQDIQYVRTIAQYTSPKTAEKHALRRIEEADALKRKKARRRI